MADADTKSVKFQSIVSAAMKSTSDFPAFRKCRLGNSNADDEHTMLIFDWTSWAEKKAFEKEKDSESTST
jgi:hypothetical protein